AQLVDHRSDVYSLGCILYEMACGRPPFLGEAVAPVLIAHLQDTPVPPRGIVATVPRALEAVILQALAKEPDARQQTCEQLAAQLELELPPGEPPRRRRGWLWAVLALVAVGATAAGVALATSRSETSPPPPPPPAPARPPDAAPRLPPDARRVADASPPDASS